MNPQTRYRYEKRIKELEERHRKLSEDLPKFKQYCDEVTKCFTECISENKRPVLSYWLERAKILWR